MKGNKQKSIELAFLLRHDKNYNFDEHGWRSVSDLIENHGYSIELLNDIVENNNKKRYEFSDDRKYIRARQGHSIDVDVELEERIPPDVLYHGTSYNAFPSIREEGIMKRGRLYVHLSDNVKTATSVGSRHGDAVVITVNAKKMVEDGIKFYLSRNGVWLTDYVDPKYFKF